MAPLAEPEGALVVECCNFYGLTIAVRSASAALVEDGRFAMVERSSKIKGRTLCLFGAEDN